jgi:hypothetical protein
MKGDADDTRKIAEGSGELPIPGLFDEFAAIDVDTRRVRFAGVTGGKGSAVLLLHGRRSVRAHQIETDLTSRNSRLAHLHLHTG